MRNITSVVVVALACASLLALSQFGATEATAADNGGSVAGIRQAVRYPTMLDMTFPEFEVATAKTDIVLLPIGAIEEHGSNLPLGSDSIIAVGQVVDVHRYLRDAGIETVVGPPLNIGITNEAGDWTRDGTYMYPGSLTVSADTFVALYLDVLRSLHDNGMRRVFLVSGHLGGRHVRAVARIAEEASRKIDGMKVYALVESERLAQLGLTPNESLVPIEGGQNFPMLTQLLGRGTEAAVTTHADGSELSLMLHYHPEFVRPGYQSLAQPLSSGFLEAVTSGDRTKNPGGMGGFPFTRASASVGKTIAAYRAHRIGDAIRQVLNEKTHSSN